MGSRLVAWTIAVCFDGHMDASCGGLIDAIAFRPEQALQPLLQSPNILVDSAGIES